MASRSAPFPASRRLCCRRCRRRRHDESPETRKKPVSANHIESTICLFCLTSRARIAPEPVPLSRCVALNQHIAGTASSRE
jgi:hypothetical protein